MNLLDEPLTPSEAKRVILQALASGDVRFTSHALDEMAKDGITQAEALGILRSGVVEPGEFDIMIGTSSRDFDLQRLVLTVHS